MTRRTKNINIVDEDVLLIHPKDAAHRDLNTVYWKIYSGRGEVALKVEVTDKVKEGIVFTTFHFQSIWLIWLQVMVKMKKQCVRNKSIFC